MMTGSHRQIGGFRQTPGVGSRPVSNATLVTGPVWIEMRRGQFPTNGWPLGLTLGPWSEWHDTISTSAGRCFSNAASSGALQEV